jgi:hypothetical protein
MIEHLVTGHVALSKGVWRDSDRRQWLIRTHSGVVPVQAGNWIIRIGKWTWVI